MTDWDTVIDIARRNFERVQAGLARDLADARTPAEARQIYENRDRALAAYMDLIGRSLEEFDGDWATLSARAVAAAGAIDAALAGARDRVADLRLAADLTSAIGDIAKVFRAKVVSA